MEHKYVILLISLSVEMELQWSFNFNQMETSHVTLMCFSLDFDDIHIINLTLLHDIPEEQNQ